MGLQAPQEWLSFCPSYVSNTVPPSPSVFLFLESFRAKPRYYVILPPILQYAFLIEKDSLEKRIILSPRPTG